MDLEEKVAMAESNSTKLEGELGDLKSDLQATQSERDTLSRGGNMGQDSFIRFDSMRIKWVWV